MVLPGKRAHGCPLQLRRHVLPGDVVSVLVQSPALTVVDTSQLRVRAELGERDALSVRVGEEAEVALPGAPSDIYLGTVTWISQIMGRKSVRSTDIAEKSDRDVREALVTLATDPPALPIDLRVVVRFSGNSTRLGANGH